LGWADEPSRDAVRVPYGGGGVFAVGRVEPGLLFGFGEDAVADVDVDGGDDVRDVALGGGVEQAVVAALPVVVVAVDGAGGVAGVEGVVVAEDGAARAAVGVLFVPSDAAARDLSVDLLLGLREDWLEAFVGFSSGDLLQAGAPFRPV